MKKLLGGICLMILVTSLSCSGSPTSEIQEKDSTIPEVPQATETLPPTEIPPTQVPLPTITPPSTNTPRPTNSPRLTSTPKPTSTSTPLPEPIVLTGSGDTVVDLGIEKFGGIAIAHVIGNTASRHFAITSYNDDGDKVELLVNTSYPYDGIVPVNFFELHNATQIEVSSVGEWKITLYPLLPEILPEYIHTLIVPGTYEGTGNDIFVLAGADPDFAKIKGNADGRHFIVYEIGRNYFYELVFTSEPYDGTVNLSRYAFLLKVIAIGEWKIEVTGK